MNTDNKKLLKEFAAIYSASNKAKQALVAELGKIDEKYKRLAEEEKKSLNELVEELDRQMAFYGPLIGVDSDAKAPKSEPVNEGGPSGEAESEKEPEPEEEPEIQDTLFPENNEPEEPTEPDPVAEDAGKPAGVPASCEPAPAEQPGGGTLAEAPAEEEAAPEAEEEPEWGGASNEEPVDPAAEGWPSMPEEWN